MILYVCVLLVVLFLSYKLFSSAGRIGDLSSRHVFITGCDSGFGYLLACKLDQLGVKVFAGCLTEHGEHKLQENCSKNLTTVRIDVTKEEDIFEAVKFVKSKLPEGQGLWGLVNNAGIDIPSPVDWAPLHEMKRLIEVNVWGVVGTTKAFLPLLRQSKGRIVNVASLAGRVPFAGHSAYNMSKHAVEAFSDCLRIEQQHFGVSVHIIEPSIYKTNLADADNICKDFKRVWNTLDEDMKKLYGENYIDKICDASKKLASRGNPNAGEVSDAMVDALLSTRPKHRYHLSWSPLALVFLCLPSSITDKLHKHFPAPGI